MAAFSSAGQVRRRPAPVNTSKRRARSGLCISSDIDMCRSSKPAPNVIPHAQRRKVQPRGRLRTSGGEAWSFEKLIETSIPAGACDTLAITSPLGTVTVQAKSTQLVARVPLGPGDNVVEAEC